jgi:hypothetical protein
MSAQYCSLSHNLFAPNTVPAKIYDGGSSRRSSRPFVAQSVVETNSCSKLSTTRGEPASCEWMFYRFVS